MMSLMTVSCESELDIEKHGNMGSMDTYYTTDENVNTGTAWHIITGSSRRTSSPTMYGAAVVSVVTMVRWRNSTNTGSTPTTL